MTFLKCPSSAKLSCNAGSLFSSRPMEFPADSENPSEHPVLESETSELYEGDRALDLGTSVPGESASCSPRISCDRFSPKKCGLWEKIDALM